MMNLGNPDHPRTRPRTKSVTSAHQIVKLKWLSALPAVNGRFLEQFDGKRYSVVQDQLVCMPNESVE
jgi:hypothetical protein